MSWLYVPGLPASNLGFLSPPLRPEPSVTWRGKPTPSGFFGRASSTAPWMMLLSGLTSERSTAARGVEEWIASLEATPVSRSRRLASAVASMTSGTYGPILPASLPRLNPQSSSAKTSTIICPSASTMSLRTWKAWATSLRQECSQRGLSVRPTSGSGSSGSVLPTPRTGSSHGAPRVLPTPTAVSYGRNAGGQNPGPDRPSLETMARQGALPTPTVSRGRNATSSRKEGSKHHSGTTLHDVAHAGGGKLHPQFSEAMMMWPIGWTDSAPLEMGLFQRWLLEHSRFFSTS